MKTFSLMIHVTFEAPSRVIAENEAKRIYAGLDDCLAEQNDPKTSGINLMLLHDQDVVRVITRNTQLHGPANTRR